MSRLRVSLGIVLSLAIAGAARGANRVEVESGSAINWSCVTMHIRVSVESDVDLEGISLPLVARTLSGNAFWAPTLDTMPSSGRLGTAFTGIRSLEKGRVDFVSPDPFLFYFRANGAGDCLPAGPKQFMTGITSHVTPGRDGAFEIDTMTYPPCFQPSFFRCSDGEALPLDEFVKGTIWVTDFPSWCDQIVDVSFDSTSLTKWAGATLSNRTHWTTIGGDEVRIHLTQGPGIVDSLTGIWTWATSPKDSGNYNVGIRADIAACQQMQCMTWYFAVHVRGLVPGDINCDGVADVLDVVREIGHAFRGEPAPAPCYEL